MSVNKYNDQTGELITLANGSRTWIGTKAAHDAAKQAGTLPNNCLVAITDDEDDGYYQEWHELVTMSNPGSYHTFVDIPENIHELLFITKYDADYSGTTRQIITSTMYIGKHLIVENEVYQIISIDWYDGGSPGNGLVRQANCVVGSTQFDFWKDGQGHEDVIVYYR